MRYELNSAYSMQNGIGFFSGVHSKMVALATIGEDNTISTEWIKFSTLFKKISKKRKVSFISGIIDALTIPLVFYFVYQLVWKQSLLQVRRSSFILFVLYLLSFIDYVFKHMKSETKKFHSAEHMIVNAYRELGKIPTLDELKKYPRFSNLCGTNFYTALTFSFLAFFFWTYIPNIEVSTVNFLVLFLTLQLLKKVGVFNFAQALVTAPPSDKHLLVAIEGLKYWLQKEKEKSET
jgi:uncharacterized protein YqhQ